MPPKGRIWGFVFWKLGQVYILSHSRHFFYSQKRATWITQRIWRESDEYWIKIVLSFEILQSSSQGIFSIHHIFHTFTCRLWCGGSLDTLGIGSWLHACIALQPKSRISLVLVFSSIACSPPFVTPWWESWHRVTFAIEVARFRSETNFHFLLRHPQKSSNNPSLTLWRGRSAGSLDTEGDDRNRLQAVGRGSFRRWGM